MELTFYKHIHSKMPRGEGDNILNWQLTWNGVFEVSSFYLLFLSLRRAFGVYKYLKGCLSFYGQQLRVGFSQLITCYEGLAPC